VNRGSTGLGTRDIVVTVWVAMRVRWSVLLSEQGCTGEDRNMGYFCNSFRFFEYINLVLQGFS